MFRSGEAELARLTGCAPPCGRFRYRMARYMDYRDSADVPDSAATPRASGAYVAVTSGDHVSLREVLRYGPQDLVASVGGYLGLLLGVSALDLFDRAAAAVLAGDNRGRA